MNQRSLTWRVKEGVVVKPCEKQDEAAVYVGFTGTAHVIADLGWIIVLHCQQAPQDIASLVEKINLAFETDTEIDLADITRQTVGQLLALGILTPCMPTA